MSATLIVRHPVTDYAAWRTMFDSDPVAVLHDKHGATGTEVLHAPDDSNDVVVIHRFASAVAAQGLIDDPALMEAMQSGGVAGPPRIEIFEGV